MKKQPCVFFFRKVYISDEEFFDIEINIKDDEQVSINVITFEFLFGVDRKEDNLAQNKTDSI